MSAETLTPPSKSRQIVKTKIAVAKGDGIGPEIMDATLDILSAAGAGAGAEIEPKFIDVGEKIYLSGNTAGISDESWDTINEAKILLKSTDHWRCRFVNNDTDISNKPKYEKIDAKSIISLFNELLEDSVDVIKTENLYYFGEERGFTLGQGE